MRENDKIRDEINTHLSEFNEVLQRWEFGFTDYDHNGFPLNFENIVETLNNVKEIISEAFEVYNELNKLLQKEIRRRNLKMSKSIYDEAVETLNKYRNQNYNSTNKDEVELANTINIILPNYVKQEKLLELYRELDDCIVAPTGHHVCRYEDDEKYARIRKQIKELENE